MAKFKEFLRYLFKILRTSAALTAIAAALSMLYSYFAQGRLFSYIFTWGFAVGAGVALLGLIVWILPIRMGKSKLLDHSTIGENLLELREQKRQRSFEMMYIGIGAIIITGTVQLVVSL